MSIWRCSMPLLRCLLLTMAALPSWDDDVVEAATVTAPSGKSQGSTVSSNGQTIRVLKGIPYALPQTGPRRWQPPQSIPDEKSLRVVTTYSPVCPQAGRVGASRTLVPSSEDCLYLNIWLTALSSTSVNDKQKNKSPKKQPVIIYIHGGGVTGSGILYGSEGINLASKGAVVVSLIHRHGVLGYFSHPELSEESPQGVSGNYGILDQIQAQRWVRKNIAAFGGDPNNITSMESLVAACALAL